MHVYIATPKSSKLHVPISLTAALKKLRGTADIEDELQAMRVGFHVSYIIDIVIM